MLLPEALVSIRVKAAGDSIYRWQCLQKVDSVVSAKFIYCTHNPLVLILQISIQSVKFHSGTVLTNMKLLS